MARRERRALQFQSLQDVLQEAENCARDETITTTGDWSAAQIIDHVAILIERSIDGFDVRAPWLLRTLGPMLRGYVLRHPMRPGVKLPAGMRSLQPLPEVGMEQAVDRLRECIQRIEAGEQMTARSPVLGTLTHAQWEQLHCRHAELHFSFMHPHPVGEHVAC